MFAPCPIRPWIAAGFLWCATACATAATIVVGHVAPLSGLEATQGRAYAAGMELHFNAVNKAGGAAGHTFSLLRKDDNGRAEDTVAATRQMLAENRPMVLAGFFGNRNITDLMASGLLERERIPLVGYRVTEVLPETPLLYSVRAGLREEINKMVEHLATIGITRVGLLYEEGTGAPALLATTEQAARGAGVSIVAKTPYPAGTARVSSAVEAQIKAAPQAIVMAASGTAAAGFIEQYRSAGGSGLLLAHSGADIERISKRLSDAQMQGVAIAQVTPNPYKVATRLSKEFADAAAKAGKLEVPVSYAMMEGYITAKVIVEAVRRQGPRPSREGMVIALDTMDADLGGYLVSFKPGMRTGSRLVELSIVSSSGRIRQ